MPSLQPMEATSWVAPSTRARVACMDSSGDCFSDDALSLGILRRPLRFASRSAAIALCSKRLNCATLSSHLNWSSENQLESQQHCANGGTRVCCGGSLLLLLLSGRRYCSSMSVGPQHDGSWAGHVGLAAMMHVCR